MSTANENELLAELRARQAEVVSGLSERVFRIEERERVRDLQLAFFRGKQVAYASLSATGIVALIEIGKQVVGHFIK